jgi:hypothetical protein
MTPRTLKLNAHRTLTYYTPEDVATMQAEIKALQDRVDQQRILAGFGDTDLRLAREQREAAYKVLRRIARYTMSQFASAIDMADACVQEAREMFPEEGGDEQGST